MSEHRPFNPSEEQAWANFGWLDTERYIGNTVMVGIAPEGGGYQQVCWLMGRDDSERNRRFETATWAQGEFVQTIREPENGGKSLVYPSLLSANDPSGKRELHVVSTGDRTRAILNLLRGDPDNSIPSQPFGTGESHYAPDARDTRHTPRVSGLLDIGLGVKNTYGRKETHVNYNILAHYRAAEASEYPLYTDAVPGTALTAHSYDPATGAPTPYTGFPYLLPIMKTPEATRDFWWEQLPSEHRVSIAVLCIEGSKRHYAIRNA